MATTKDCAEVVVTAITTVTNPIYEEDFLRLRYLLDRSTNPFGSWPMRLPSPEQLLF